MVLSEVSYNKGGTIGNQSALSALQWQTLYNYQVAPINTTILTPHVVDDMVLYDSLQD